MTPRRAAARIALTVALLAAVGCGSDFDESPADPDAGADPSASCPTHLVFESLGDLTRIDVGYTGLAHGGALPTNSVNTYELYDCDDECRRCRLRGPVRGADDATVRQRCLGDLRLTCDSDSDCGSAGPCRFQLRTVSNNSAGQCSATYFEDMDGPEASAVQGIYDLHTGDAQFQVVNLARATYAGACQNCVGDITAYDGVKDGYCESHPHISCDVHGQGGPPAYITSFDCPLPGGGDHTRTPFPLPDLGSTSKTWAMDSTRPNCTMEGFEDTSCWCGVCSDGTPCFNDSECSSGTCGQVGGLQAPPTLPSICKSGVCDWDEETQTGTCLADVDGLGTDIPVGCFPDSGTITVEGGAEARDGYFITTVAGLSCYPATRTQTDSVFGLPGVMYTRIPYRVTPVTVDP